MMIGPVLIKTPINELISQPEYVSYSKPRKRLVPFICTYSYKTHNHYNHLHIIYISIAVKIRRLFCILFLEPFFPLLLLLFRKRTCHFRSQQNHHFPMSAYNPQTTTSPRPPKSLRKWFTVDVLFNFCDIPFSRCCFFKDRQDSFTQSNSKTFIPQQKHSGVGPSGERKLSL